MGRNGAINVLLWYKTHCGIYADKIDYPNTCWETSAWKCSDDWGSTVLETKASKKYNTSETVTRSHCTYPVHWCPPQHSFLGTCSCSWCLLSTKGLALDTPRGMQTLSKGRYSTHISIQPHQKQMRLDCQTCTNMLRRHSKSLLMFVAKTQALPGHGVWGREQ